jgi:transcriptional regulator with XRE-family HTH domain
MTARTQAAQPAIDPANIAPRRRALGLYQNQLARLAGVSPQHVSILEAGRKPISPRLARRVVAILDAYEVAHIIMRARLAEPSAA